MSYNVNTGAYLEATIRSEVLGQTCLSIFHYRWDSTAGAQDGDTLADKFRAAFDTAANSLLKKYAACMGTGAGLRELVVQWLYPTRRARKSYVPSQAAGLIVGDLATSNIAGAITKQSDDVGRHAQSTLHMPGIPANMFDAGKVNDEQLGNYAVLGGKIKEVLDIDFDLGQFVPVIFNRVAPNLSKQITHFTVRDTLRTMHRRTVGLGE